MSSSIRTILLERGNSIHVPEGTGTHGKRDAKGVARLYVTVANEAGDVLYETWQNGPLDQWERVTLYFDRIGVDGEGKEIGISFWG